MLVYRDSPPARVLCLGTWKVDFQAIEERVAAFNYYNTEDAGDDEREDEDDMEDA